MPRLSTIVKAKAKLAALKVVATVIAVPRPLVLLGPGTTYATAPLQSLGHWWNVGRSTDKKTQAKPDVS